MYAPIHWLFQLPFFILSWRSILSTGKPHTPFSQVPLSPFQALARVSNFLPTKALNAQLPYTLHPSYTPLGDGTPAITHFEDL